MLCEKCGYNVEEGMTFCPNCGARLGGGKGNNGENAQQTPSSFGFEPVSGAGGFENSPSYRQYVMSDRAGEDGAAANGEVLPMKWHNFLAYFAFWFGAINNVLSGRSIMLGTQYEEDAEAIYRTYGALKSLDLTFGAVTMCMAILCVIAALKLLGRKRNAPKFLLLTYAVSATVSTVYNVLGLAIIKNRTPYISITDSVTPLVITVAVYALIIFLNSIYYKKREHLFVN